LNIEAQLAFICKKNESLALASMARDVPTAMRGKVGSEFET